MAGGAPGGEKRKREKKEKRKEKREEKREKRGRGKKKRKTAKGTIFQSFFHYTYPALTPGYRFGNGLRLLLGQRASPLPGRSKGTGRKLLRDLPAPPKPPLRPPPYRGSNSRWGESRCGLPLQNKKI